MISSLFFATKGFGLNLNLFETNVINLAVVIFGLYKFLPNFLGGILERRRSAILADLKDAEDRLTEANTALAKAKNELASAEQKAEKIRSDCKVRAEAIRLESEKKTVEEMARVKQGAAADLNAEASRVSTQLRREAAKLAIEKALVSLPNKLDEKAQLNFISQSIKNMGKD
ncbi:F0F1 ATP synthase subunit B [Prochlorococcus marinus]|uniref:ATP synthase subunit b n=1 Tax=Prochlorococcus marinus (strain MIT 9211) TaxID=93059 RepID=ATPF_PROM4|nr:F0F1 ATP synthase subunit B [Prochlorococcus marinus]A9BCE1.1 RecName: Full=ATP synthase subunit b; AltName: Full=ATP synthase F(0) sector subunit b; AltName: Full=ATPase subunit I; AltName: Full=F-type ATPase subunit b; Short=F-ATPase subunit b [Prochlorococcus marinus str. MIT 9211]ABX09503.1 ATP synthase B/B' CF(0) [Prochlorococcus marinus str. MIT 9211]